MSTYFCLVCFAEVAQSDGSCPTCNADLEALDDETLDERLIRALGHRLADRRVIAANALGARHAASAEPVLIQLAVCDPDPYVAAACVRALDQLGSDRALAAVRHIASDGPVVARAIARDVVARHEQPKPGS